ncbi:MAG: SAM-dependent methyltransferase [Gammaproteobacteria bacterium]|nr:SAM-dependent methyltransferase [Gammaproteobacteria bacterium]
MQLFRPNCADSGQASSLPSPSADELRHSEALSELIVAQMNLAGGRLPFDRFMELVLYAPGLGYYSSGSRKLGADGDFITAPEVSPLFARALARQYLQVAAELGGGDLLEFGAGSGVLAVEMLLELERLRAPPQLYLIVEVSAELRARQQTLVAERLSPGLASRVRWLEGIPPVGFRGMVVANEVVDAMPVHRFRLRAGARLEQWVSWNGERFLSHWDSCSKPLAAELARLGAEIALPGEDYESELNLRAAPWLTALSERLQAGLVLLIDYGYPRAEFYLPERSRGTLMCHYRHRAHDDPLRYPGVQDITAHVDFTALAEAALASGLSVCGYTTQAFFLFGCGLQEMVAAADTAGVREHIQLMQEVKRLTLPSEMGERFKVLGVSRGISQPPIGFSLQDLRGRL